ncbi:MAG TPA: hypothetical protein VK469_05885 [Candidatus Kapabacteria bacterium]|nr:hypothetical protein [Candidatus Kapabacteria bacterium]
MKHFFESNRKLVFICALLLASITMTSCTAIGAFSKMNSFKGKYSIALDNSRADILTIIEEVGKSMSLQVSQLDATQGIISLSSGSVANASYLYGKFASRSIYTRTLDSGRKLEIEIEVMGNFGTGVKEEADKVFDDFKMKLLEKVGNS